MGRRRRGRKRPSGKRFRVRADPGRSQTEKQPDARHARLVRAVRRGAAALVIPVAAGFVLLFVGDAYEWGVNLLDSGGPRPTPTGSVSAEFERFVRLSDWEREEAGASRPGSEDIDCARVGATFTIENLAGATFTIGWELLDHATGDLLAEGVDARRIRTRTNHDTGPLRICVYAEGQPFDRARRYRVIVRLENTDPDPGTADEFSGQTRAFPP